MEIGVFRTDTEVAVAIGASIARLRLRRMRTQKDVAARAGVSVLAVRRLERGSNTTVLTLIAVLRELGGLQQLLSAFPTQQAPTPMELLARAEPERRRAPRRKVK